MSQISKIYHVETQEEYDDLMILLEELGYKWQSGNLPSSKNHWSKSREDTAIYLYEFQEYTIGWGYLSTAQMYHHYSEIEKYKIGVLQPKDIPAVPKYVADYIENYYHQGLKPNIFDKVGLLRDLNKYIDSSGYTEVREWIKNTDNFLTFVKAIVTNKYVIEKAYYWKRKDEYSLKLEDSNSIYLNYRVMTGVIFFGDKLDTSLLKTKFTVREIKDLVGDDFNKLEKVEITE